MSTRTLIMMAAAASLLALGCAKQEAAAPAVDLAAEEQAIRDRSAEWMGYAQAKDVAAMVNGIYTADAITLFDGTIRRGAAEIQAGAEKELVEAPDLQVSWTTTAVKVAASGDLAWETGDVSVDADGAGEGAAETGSFITVWTKVDGQWRAVADAGTMVAAPAAETTAPAGG